MHHSAYNWQEIADHATLIVNKKNALKGVDGRRDQIIGTRDFQKA